MVCKSVIFLFISLIFINKADNKVDDYKFSDVCISMEELLLYRMINEYRESRGLSFIPLSKSLTYVAKCHAMDLAENSPQNKRCNLHSWSESNKWKGCCYTHDHKNAGCMWYKPKEMTNYGGIGYEVAYYSTYPEDFENFPLTSLEAWKKSESHHAIIANTGSWHSATWKAMGVGIYRNYAVAWFGDKKDKEGSPVICN